MPSTSPTTLPPTSFDIAATTFDITDIAFDIADIAFGIADIDYDIAFDIADIGYDIDININFDISDKGALSLLNLANNNIGGVSLPAGWKDVQLADKSWEYQHADGRTQKDGIDKKPFGLIAIADAIKNMGALTQLDISNNKLGQGEPIYNSAGNIDGYTTETAGVL
jgi:hypothetical protein